MAAAINAPVTPHLADDPTWRAEFRGFFWGEGWLGIDMFKVRRNGGLYTVHRPSFQIAQANSNYGVLAHIQAVLGGSLYARQNVSKSKGRSHDAPYWTWMTRANATCRQICDMLLEGNHFPDKKLEKLQAMDKFLSIVEGLNGATRTEAILDRMDELRLIVSPNAKPREK